MLSFAHIPLARHPEAEEIVRQLVESFMSEVRDINNVFFHDPDIGANSID